MMTDEQKRAEAVYDRNTWPGPLPKQVEAAAPVEPAKHPLAGKSAGVRATSREALSTVDLSDKQRKVLVAIQMNGGKPLCNQEIAESLNWPINQVTGRVSELVELGKVEEKYRDVYAKTGRRVIYWGVVGVQS